MKSAVYEGMLRHRRHAPTSHRFEYQIFMMYLDLAELPTLFDGHWFWSARHWAPARWRRQDFLGNPELPLDEAVRRLVHQRAGFTPTGPIRMLTNLRYWGVTMNPVTFYYCFDPSGDRVIALVAEITNTPWNERHSYVLVAGTDDEGSLLNAEFPKAFHVSPFFPMTHRYLWQFNAPGDRLDVEMSNRQDGQLVFDASLQLVRREICRRQLAATLWRYPWMTLRVAVGIYWQALRLWWKRTPFHSHPMRSTK